MRWFSPEQLCIDLSMVENGTVSLLRATLLERGLLDSGNRVRLPESDDHRFGTDGSAIYEVLPEGLRLMVMGASHSSYDVLPDCVEIGRNAFAGLSALESVALPASLRRIGAFAFARTGLRTLDAPASVTAIGEKAFLRCRGLTDVLLPEGLHAIGNQAFAQCPLDELVVPASVCQLGRGVVSGNVMEIAAENPRFFVDGGVLYRRLDPDHVMASPLAVVEAIDPAMTECRPLPETVEIGDEAFYHHPSIQQVDLPDEVQIIGVQAFRGCRKLQSVRLPDALRVIKPKAFANTRLGRLQIPASLNLLGLNALLTQGDERLCPPPYLIDVSVDQGNPSFYMESGLLCERGTADTLSQERGYSAYADTASIAPMSYFGGTNEDRSRVLAEARGEDADAERPTIQQATMSLDATGGDTVVQYAGSDEVVVIPPQVEAIAPYAFAGVRSVRELYLHPRIRNVGLCAFALAGAIPLVHLELEQPVDGRTSIDLTFPDNDYGARALEYAFAGGMAGPVAFCSYWDDSIIKTEDPFERGRLILDRLHDPIFLDEEHRRQFYRILRTNVRSIAKSFASHNYVAGFDRLIDEGVLDEANITEVIDHLSGDEVAMTGYLLEIKRRRFGMNLDFSL